MDLTTFNIKGERCSGTNYLQKLIETNLKVRYLQDCNVGWKHGFLTMLTKRTHEPETFLTIVIFRNPFDWVRSLYLTPHYLEHSHDGAWLEGHIPTFSQYLRNEVSEFSKFKKEIFSSCHPLTLEKAKNILQVRNWKNEHFLNLKNALPNTYYVRYEDLVENPEKIITEINDTFFNVELKFENWNKRAFSNQEFVKRKYFDISEEDYTFILANLDWELESKIGYTPIMQ